MSIDVSGIPADHVVVVRFLQPMTALEREAALDACAALDRACIVLPHTAEGGSVPEAVAHEMQQLTTKVAELEALVRQLEGRISA